MDHEQLGALSARQGWIYSFRLPDGTLTRQDPESDTIRAKLEVLQSMDLRGKRILDMGCAEGLYAFYCAEQGAAEVLGVDIDEHRIEKARFAADALGFDNVRFENGDVLEARYRDGLGRFDLVLAWGFLHRVPDPFNALIALGSVSDALSLEWLAYAPPFGARRSVALHPRGGTFEWKNIHGMTRADVQENVKGKQQGRAPFWLLSQGAIETILQRIGFSSFEVRDRSRGQRRWHLKLALLAQVDRLRGRQEHQLRDPVMSKRVMMLAQRKAGAIPIGDLDAERVRIAAWHHAPGGKA